MCFPEYGPTFSRQLEGWRLELEIGPFIIRRRRGLSILPALSTLTPNYHIMIVGDHEQMITPETRIVDKEVFLSFFHSEDNRREMKQNKILNFYLGRVYYIFIYYIVQSRVRYFFQYYYILAGGGNLPNCSIHSFLTSSIIFLLQDR